MGLFFLCVNELGELKQAGKNFFFAEILMAYLYQHFGAKLKVFLVISQGDKVVIADGYRVAIGSNLLPM